MKNSIYFVSIDKRLNLSEDDLLVSFDVVSLFPSVSVDKTLFILRPRLENDDTLTNRAMLSVNTILELLSICVNPVYFKCKDKFYNQKEGLPMGLSLSPLLADIYIVTSQFRIKKVVFNL